MASKRSLEKDNIEILHAAVDAFRKRELGYRDILEELPAAIYTIDSEGRITYYNKACVELSGRTPTLGDDQWCVIWKLYSADGTAVPHAHCATAATLREGRAIHGVEAIAERPDGTRIAVRGYPTPIFDSDGQCVGAVNMLVDVTEQKRSQERLELLAREVDHRSNNILTVVQSLARLTKADTIAEYQEKLAGRLTAVARANSLISEKRWQNVDLQSLLGDELAAFSDRKVTLSGEPIAIRPESAQSFAIIVHELCTNAVKHGALSSESGEISVSWSVDGSRELMFKWAESGGPATREPKQSNTGNRVIDGAVKQLGGRLFREWRSKGLHCTLLCSMSRL
jgi:PAS domain S-box-containing protein